MLPCVPLAATVTSIGRQLISDTRDIIMSHYSVGNGFHSDATVVFGDTDSVMIDFHLKGEPVQVLIPVSLPGRHA